MNSSPPVVKKKISGSTVVNIEYLRKKLGNITFDVWTAFLWRRNEEGISFASASSIARSKDISQPSVKRACDKLEKIELIKGAEWVISKGRRRFKRIIFGDYRKGVVTIPKKCKELMSSLPKWGGTRQGAGRKGKPCSNQDDISIYPKQSGEFKSYQVGIKMIPSRYQDDTTLKRSFKRGDKFLKEFMPELAAPKNDFVLKKTPEHLFFPDIEEVRDEPPRKEIMDLPPYPSVSRVGIAKLPAPPLLDPEATMEKKVDMMVRAYRGAVESRYNKRCFAFSRGDIRNSKYWKLLTEAAETLCDFEASPFSWAAFSMDAWIKYSATPKNKKKPPPANWVYSAKRIADHSSWFQRESTNYSGGRLYFTNKHKEILRRYDGLRRDSMRVEITEEVMERWFPGGWEQFYARAKGEAADDQARLNKMAARGDFIW